MGVSKIYEGTLITLLVFAMKQIEVRLFGSILCGNLNKSNLEK